MNNLDHNDGYVAKSVSDGLSANFFVPDEYGNKEKHKPNMMLRGPILLSPSGDKVATKCRHIRSKKWIQREHIGG